MLRSPSHESVTTDLSLFSVSSIASDALARGMRLVSFKPLPATARGPSPNPDSAAPTLRPPKQADIPEILWLEEENDLMKSCAALSLALGLHKSFSTGDISRVPSPDEPPPAEPRNAVSELAFSCAHRSGFIIEHPRLEHASRSCSTWVAVGDVVSTSQLPSPHGGPASATNGSDNAVSAPTPSPSTPAFATADLVRSVNKKVRQNYIRRRLLTTYRALERLSQSEFNLDQLEVTARSSPETTEPAPKPCLLSVPGSSPVAKPSPKFPKTPTNVSFIRAVHHRSNRNLPLTIRDVERERGKPLSKYERNMMIFNWLHTLDDSAFEGENMLIVRAEEIGQAI